MADVWDVIRFAQRRLSAFGSPQMQVRVCFSHVSLIAGTTPFTPMSQAPAAISQATSVMADMIVFATMCYSLRPARYPEIAV